MRNFALLAAFLATSLSATSMAAEIPGGGKGLDAVLSESPFLSNAKQPTSDGPPLEIKLLLPYDSFEEGKSYTALLEIQIADGYHANSAEPLNPALIPTRATFTADDERVTVGRVVYPGAELKKFSFSNDELSVYEGKVYISTSISLTSDGTASAGGEWNAILKAVLDYQVCTDVMCLMPMRAEAEEKLNVGKQGESINKEAFAEFEKQTKHDEAELMSGLDKSSGLGMFLLVFLGGLALNLTPCVYPIIPVTIGIFGRSTGRPWAETAFHATVYLLGMAAMYSALGTFAALTGSLFGEMMQNPIVILLLVVIMLVLSLSMFGVYDIAVPQSLLKLSSRSYGGYFGTFFMGLTVGIIAAPCVGPFVIALLTYVGERQDPFLGFSLFFVLALGLGLPFLFLAIFSGMIGSLPRSGAWMVWVRSIFGVVLVGMALYFAQPLLPKKTTAVLASLISLGGAAYLFHSGRNIKGRGFAAIRYGATAGLVALAAWFAVPSDDPRKETLHFETYSTQAYDSSMKNGNPSIVYFTADWCVPCRELKLFTFTDEKLRAVVKEKGFDTFVIDLTTLEPDEQITKERFSIKGVPTVIIFAPGGTETGRFTGFVPADELLNCL